MRLTRSDVNRQPIRRERRNKVRTLITAVGSGVFLTVCSPMSEAIASANDAKPATPDRTEREAPSGTVASQPPQQKTSQSGPLALTEEMEQTLEKMFADFGKLDYTPSNLSRRFHEYLKSGAPNGVKAISMRGKKPRTAAEAFVHGGDCTDLANVAVAMLDKAGLAVGALIVHFNNSPKELYHMVAYVEVGGKKVMLDLQADELGKTKDGDYTVIAQLNSKQVPSMYYTEMGDYLKDQGKLKQAAESYEKALTFYERDGYVHHKLGMIYQELGNMEMAEKHHRRAAELDPKYGTAHQTIDYNEELRKGQEAYNDNRWGDCIIHFTNALNSGEKLTKQERDTIQMYVDDCKKRQ